MNQTSRFNLLRHLLEIRYLVNVAPPQLLLRSLHLFSWKSPSPSSSFLLEFLAFLHNKFVLDVSSLPLGSLVTQTEFIRVELTSAHFL